MHALAPAKKRLAAEQQQHRQLLALMVPTMVPSLPRAASAPDTPGKWPGGCTPEGSRAARKRSWMSAPVQHTKGGQQEHAVSEAERRSIWQEIQMIRISLRCGDSL